MIVATNTGILIQTTIFSEPIKCLFVPEPNQSSITRRETANSTKTNMKMQRKETSSLSLSVVLQKCTELKFILEVGFKLEQLIYQIKPLRRRQEESACVNI